MAVSIFVLWIVSDIVIALAFGCTILLLQVIHHVRHLVALGRWLRTSDLSLTSMPKASGMWEDVFAALARVVRFNNQDREKLSLALERMQHATSALPDGIVLLDKNDHIEWCNSRAEHHLGINLELDFGQQITYLVRQVQFVAYLNNKDFSHPLILRHDYRHQLVLSLQLVPYGYQQKLLISRDITRFEQVDTMRRDFIANISHELRTPLTVVGGFLETLLEEDQTDQVMSKQALTLMTEQTTRMQRLIEDLLTLSRLENAPSITGGKKVDIVKILYNLVREAESLSNGRHQIKLNLMTDIELIGNERELYSALSNLISNAVRYTPDGGEISLSWSIQDDQGLFSVKDSGIGIDPEHIPRLTERFYRIDSGRSRATGGTGLGLAIVKHVLNRHHARLEILSTPGEGSRFNIWFSSKQLLLRSSSDSQEHH